MAYLDNTEITVDAILTKKGREKLATGEGLNITRFALGDDEIDYGLYEPAHPKGSAYYDAAIKAIPILEASPDETQVLRYKLVTLPKSEWAKNREAARKRDEPPPDNELPLDDYGQKIRPPPPTSFMWPKMSAYYCPDKEKE